MNSGHPTALKVVFGCFGAVVLVSLLDSKVLNCCDTQSCFIGGLTVHEWILRPSVVGSRLDAFAIPKTPKHIEYGVPVEQIVSGAASPEIEQEPSPPMGCKLRGREG
jgi:hypothetical protein